jgi:hypothetical protein
MMRELLLTMSLQTHTTQWSSVMAMNAGSWTGPLTMAIPSFAGTSCKRMLSLLLVRLLVHVLDASARP